MTFEEAGKLPDAQHPLTGKVSKVLFRDDLGDRFWLWVESPVRGKYNMDLTERRKP